jgi:hypothetical protein
MGYSQFVSNCPVGGNFNDPCWRVVDPCDPRPTLTILPEGEDILLNWTPILGTENYAIFYSFEHSVDPAYRFFLDVTDDTTYRHVGGTDDEFRFYQVHPW